MKANFITFPKLMILFVILLIIPSMIGCSPQEEPIPQTEEIIQPTTTIEPVIEQVPTVVTQPLLLTNDQIISPQQIGVNHSFSFQFNQPVDMQSFESGFSLSPSVQGDFTWLDEATVRFTANQPLSLGTHYTAKIETTVYAQSGSFLDTAITQNFITVGPMRLTSSYPIDQTTDVDIHTPIWVTFNHPIAENIGDDTPVPFTIEPAIPGAGRWANSSTYIFYPSEELISSTTYTIIYNSDFSSLLGASYETVPANINFSTQEPKVISIEPEDLSMLEPGQNITISFNQEMDQESVVANLRLENMNAEEIFPEMQWDESNTKLTILGGDYFPRGDMVLVFLNPAAQTRTGIPLNESLRRQYDTMPVFDFDGLPESSIEVTANGYAELVFHSNVPLDPDQDFVGLVDIRNSTPGNFTATLDDAGQTLTYSGFFIPGTFYSYSLSPDLHDLWGQTLGDVIFKRIATQSAPSSILIDQYDAPPSHLYLPLTDIQIPIETTNIRRVDMQSVPLSIEDYIQLYCDYSDCLQYKEFEYTRYWYQSVYPYIVNAPVPSEITMAPRFRTLDAGLYVFELDSPDLKSRDPLRYFGIASNVNITTHLVGNELLIWAVDTAAFTPVANAPILVYDTAGEILDGGTTDAQGLLKITNIQTGTYHIALYQPEHPQFGFNTVTISDHSNVGNSAVSGGEFFFDRPVYHPGTTVNFLFYPDSLLNQELIVDLVYEYQGQDNIVDAILLTNSLGTAFSGSFRIPESLPLGSYSLMLPGYSISHPMTVTEIKSSDTAIDIQFAQDTFAFGDSITGEFSIHLADAIPIPGQTINWSATISPSSITQEGSCITDDAGICSFSLSQNIFNALSPEDTYPITINASSEVLSNTYSKSTFIYPGIFQIEMQSETWLGTSGEAFGIEVQTLQHNGDALPSIDLDARFEKITFTDTPSFAKDKEIITREIETTQIASTAFSTDENGYARLTFTPTDTGIYRITIYKGNYAEESWFYVDGINLGEWLVNEQELQTITDKETYKPGETAQLFLPNPFITSTKVLLTIQNQSEYREQIITIEGATKIVDLVIKDSDYPYANLTMTFIGGDYDGKVGYRESTLQLAVQKEKPKLTIESDLQFTTDQKGLLKVNISDSDGEPIEANYSILVIPTNWLSRQSTDQVFFDVYTASNNNIFTDTSLSEYIRLNKWKPNNSTDTADILSFLPTVPSEPLSGTNSIFLTNLSTSADGESFIEFPFEINNDAYTYSIMAVSTDGTTGTLQSQINLINETEIASTNQNLAIFSNTITSMGQEVVDVPVPYGLDSQDWQLVLYGDDLTAIQSFARNTTLLADQPATIASNLLSTQARNGLTEVNYPTESYIDLLLQQQNEDGGWGYHPNMGSDTNLTTFITFCLLESGTSSLMEEENVNRLTTYLTETVETELAIQAENRYALQSMTLQYQELSDVVAQYNTLPISEQFFLIQGLAQQPDSTTTQTDILTTIVKNVLYDADGAYFAGDGSNTLYGADESTTSMVLLLLGRLQPQSELIPQIRNWLIHQGLTKNITDNPIGNALTLLALQRTMQLTTTSEDFGIQVLQEGQSIAQLSASEITSDPYLTTLHITAANPRVSIIHEEGQGNLYYQLSAPTIDNDNVFNGIELVQNFYAVGEECRPGYCIPQTNFSTSSENEMIEMDLNIIVPENLDNVVLSLPSSQDYFVYPTIEVLGNLTPQITSPLEYGINQTTFYLSENDEAILFNAKELQAGTYEIKLYIKPLIDGEISIKSTTIYDQFSGMLYGQTQPTILTITQESNSNE